MFLLRKSISSNDDKKNPINKFDRKICMWNEERFSLWKEQIKCNNITKKYKNIEGSGSGRTNPLLNILYSEPDINKCRYQ